ncbi:MAG: pyridoxamine 5'-phosphate oxidase family protein [Neisseria sp.]|nr:pyridoxamine 5'-phosphate oxidase family protein [Neisseria sp.]
MPENIFKQISLDILRLHQQTCRTLLATHDSNATQVREAVYVTIDGRYYVLLPQISETQAPQSGILLIEADDAQARLSWVASARPVKQKSSLYRRALEALQRRVLHTRHPAADACLLELTPQQGRLTLRQNRDFALSPADLVRALYPAGHTIGAFAM